MSSKRDNSRKDMFIGSNERVFDVTLFDNGTKRICQHRVRTTHGLFEEDPEAVKRAILVGVESMLNNLFRLGEADAKKEEPPF